MMKTIFSPLRILFAAVTVLMLLDVALAQGVAPTASTVVQTPDPTPPATTRTQARRPLRRATTPPARVTVIASQAEVAPQVVTIVHRLSGLKILRLLLRQAGERGTVATIDPQAIMSDVHTSIIAGWAFEDGKTIAARLPQATAEIELTEFAVSPAELKSQARATAATRPSFAAPRSEPDLTIVTRDGRRLRARYVGLDGQTGLSVLQVNGEPMVLRAENGDKKLAEGQTVQLFTPERTTPEGATSPGNIYVRVGVIDAKIAKVARGNSGDLERLTVRAAKLSPVVIGGVACDLSGNTLGIVEAIEGNDARIIPADTIRAATRRVLERQASVPRPLLGVRGEPVEFASRAAFLLHGWREDQLAELKGKQVGILLTSVLPGTPAALANLLPGDVIMQVNKDEVRDAEEFSKLLVGAGSGEQVKFTVRRPTAPSPFAIDLTLGGSYEPVFEYRFEMPLVAAPPENLQGLGMETIALSRGGLLVVGVKPESLAARGDMREGDVIESIDGRAVGRGEWAFGSTFNRQKKHVLSLVRGREKKQIVLAPVE